MRKFGMPAQPPRRSPVRATMVLVVPAFVVAGCSVHRPGSSAPSVGPVQVGTASWYGGAFQGNRTASGERFDQHAFTAASRSLPIGARVRVTNLTNRRSAVVRINDRGPFVHNRVLDMSYASAHALGMIEHGTARVRIEPLDTSAPARTAPTRRRCRGRCRRRSGGSVKPSSNAHRQRAPGSDRGPPPVAMRAEP
jgi:rare lipoprotein A